MKCRMAPGLVALLTLSGCAAGSSMSISQAPLSFIVDEDGAYEVGARDDGTTQALAENGTFETGVPGYATVGGNALLPVPAALVNRTAVDAIAANAVLGMTTGPAPTAVGPLNTVGANASVSVSGGASAAGTSVQATANPALGAAATVTTNPTGVSIASTLQSPGAAATVQVAAAPSTIAVSRSLTSIGPLLGAPTTVQTLATSTPAGTSNSLLAAVAAQIGKRCTLPGCK